MPSCARCGQDNPTGFRLCGMCGAPLEPDSEPREARKVVTVLFADIADSTSLTEALDPETLRRVVGRYFDDVRSALERHGGTVEKFIGDAVMAVFGVPVAHEDDALRAVRAGIEAQDAVAGLSDELRRTRGIELRARIGIHTGEVVAGDAREGQRFVTGDAVVVAKRLESAAPPGGILVGAPTQALVRAHVVGQPAGALELKGRAQAVEAFRIDGLHDPESARRSLPFVGREAERAGLREAFDSAVADRSCRLVTIVGEAGVGKSRLVAEFLAEIAGDVRVLRGRCLPYGDGITFWPLREVVSELAELELSDPPDRARAKIADAVGDAPVAAAVGRLIGVDATAAGGTDGIWAVRTFLELVGRGGPLVVVFDDLQWADALFLDVVEHVAASLPGAPVLIVGIARPEFLERRGSWGMTATGASTVLLEPLAQVEAAALVESARAGRSLPPAKAAAIVERAGGNPLFLEELLEVLVADVESTAASGIPPTVRAVLAARLDQLSPHERIVLERAAVAGEVFSRDGLAAILPGDLDVDPLLLTLVRKNLVRAEDDERFRFRHILIRDAAYEAMPKDLRAEVHERDADALEARAGDRADEYAEIVAHHLAAASRYRRELGLDAERADALAARAAAALAKAADRAIALSNWAAVERRLTRALELAPPHSTLRLPLMVELGQAVFVLGDLRRAKAIHDEAAASRVGDEVAAAEARLYLANTNLSLGLASDTSALRDATADAVAVFEAAGDDRRLGRAALYGAVAHSLACRRADERVLLERGLVSARRAGDDATALYLRAKIGWALLFGPSHIAEAHAYWETFAEDARARGRLVEEWVIRAFGHVNALEGRFEEARELAATSAELAGELGPDYQISFAYLTWLIEWLAGRPAAAEPALSAAVERLRSAGEAAILSTHAALLAEAKLAVGDVEGAENLTRMSEELGAADDVMTQVTWRSVGARVAAVRGKLGTAERLAREAVGFVDRADEPLLIGRAHEALGEVVRLNGATREAEAELALALATYERKGIRPAADRLRAKLGSGAISIVS